MWLVLAVASCYVLALGGEADEEAFAAATVNEPVSPSAQAAPGRPPTSGARGRAPARHRGAPERAAAVRVPRRRRSGTKQRLVSVFRQGLAVLLSVLIAGHALPKPSWKPEAWLEFRCEIKTSPQQPPTPIPKNPSL